MLMHVAPTHSHRSLPSVICGLGFVSLLMNILPKMTQPATVVHGHDARRGTIAVGVVEGLAESLALTVKIFSGTLSDYLGKRKGLALCGDAIGALTTPLFSWGPYIGILVTARFLDRLGKSKRGAPTVVPALGYARTNIPMLSCTRAVDHVSR